MKTLVVLVFGLVLLELGSALKCYTCEKGLCNITQVCTTEDSCLSASSGDNKFKKCLKYDDCNMMNILQMYPGFSSIKFSCCTSNLCNTESVADNSVWKSMLSKVRSWWDAL
nr:CD59 glycoprotein-like isoform X1 [Misgurnus anguillicaudatus]